MVDFEELKEKLSLGLKSNVFVWKTHGGETSRAMYHLYYCRCDQQHYPSKMLLSLSGYFSVESGVHRTWHVNFLTKKKLHSVHSLQPLEWAFLLCKAVISLAKHNIDDVWQHVSGSGGEGTVLE